MKEHIAFLAELLFPDEKNLQIRTAGANFPSFSK